MDDILQPVLDLPSGATVPLRPLMRQLKGRIIPPDHEDYDQVRAIALGNWDTRPALIVRVADAKDVAITLDFARQHGLEIAVRSGGHSTCGFGSSDNGLVIDLRDINALDIAEDRSWAWAGAGLTAGEVTTALEAHQRIIGFGDAATVGIGGLTLGGGIGYLVRKHGLTIDSLLAIEVVTPSGDILIADVNNHPDLFWALRGGGGNFGVVTRFQYRLHPLPEFTGGPLLLPATPEVLTGFIAAAEAAPDELSTIVMVMPAPPLPFIPAELVGKTIIMAMMAFAGPATQAAEALAPFRALATPIADLVGPATMSSMYIPEDPGMKPAVSVRTSFVDGITFAAARDLIDLVEQNQAPMHMAQIRVLGGAAARVPADATAFAHRDAPIMMAFLALDHPAALPQNEAWVDTCMRTLCPEGRGAYVNFLAGDGAARLGDAYPEATLLRLKQVKRRYDPANILRLNQNVTPAGAGDA
ncbi:FAD-binding oxidoreductase [Devosia sp. CAU 1758]